MRNKNKSKNKIKNITARTLTILGLLGILLIIPVANAETTKFLKLPFTDPDVKLQQGWIYNEGGPHYAIDYIKGTIDRSPTWKSFDVEAATDGQAQYAVSTTWGNYVVIKHVIGEDTYYVVNAHLESSPLPLNKWTDVKQGEKIGIAGQTGKMGCANPSQCIHLHFEFSKNGYGKIGEKEKYNKDPYGISSTRKSLSYPPFKPSGVDHYWIEDPYNDDIYWLAKILTSEMNVQDGNAQERIAVGWTVLNRLDSGKYGSTIKEVSKGFAASKEPVSYEIIYQATDLYKRRISDPTGGTNHFFSPKGMPKKGEEYKCKPPIGTGSYDCDGGLFQIPGYEDKGFVYIPSWAKPKDGEITDLTDFYKTTNGLQWVSGLYNVRNWWGMFYRPEDNPIGKGLQYLRNTQNSDGSWSYFGTPSVGITSLATLSFINYGLDETDSTGKKAIEWISSQYQSNGIISYPKTSGGRESDDVYDTSMAIMALVATNNHKYNDKIKGATNFLFKAQNDEPEYQISNQVYGGWGYPRSNWADLSNSQFAIMALDAAATIENNKRIPIVSKNDPVWNKIQVFLARTQNREEKVVVKIGGTDYTINPDYNYYNDGGFMYGPGYTNFAGGRSYGSMTAAGVWSLLLSNVDVTDPRLSSNNGALNWLDKQHYYVNQNYPIGNTWVYYYDMTLSKALIMAEAKGWKGNHDWYKDISDFLKGRQATDGHWPNIEEGIESTDILTTIEAILSLEIKNIAENSQRLSWVSFILNSNADLHVYDPLGRHVGKNYKTGKIEINIPGATFSNGKTQKISVKGLKTGNYKVKLIGTGEGKYDLSIKGGIGNITTSEDSSKSTISKGIVHEGYVGIAMIIGPTIYIKKPESISGITVISPNGGENWQPGNEKTIIWRHSINSGPNVKIELLKAGKINRVISSNALNNGSFNWTIPLNQIIGKDYKIRVTSTNNPTYTDTSDNNFAIGNGATVNLLKNPGFETSSGSGPSYWIKYQTGNKAIFSYETGRIGGKSGAVKYLAKEINKVGIWRQDNIIINPSSQYKLSGYMKLQDVTGSTATPRPGGASIRVTWFNSQGNLINTEYINKKGTIGWTKYEAIFKAPSNAVKATVGGDLFDSSGKVWIDDLEFIKIS